MQTKVYIDEPIRASWKVVHNSATFNVRLSFSYEQEGRKEGSKEKRSEREKDQF